MVKIRTVVTILLCVLETFFHALTKTFSILHFLSILTSNPSLFMDSGPFFYLLLSALPMFLRSKNTLLATREADFHSGYTQNRRLVARI